MKSKAGTFILLAAAVAVWGVIAWKIVDRKEPDFVPPLSERPAPVRDKNPRDTLWLNYRDPFLGNVRRSVAEMGTELDEVVPMANAVFNVRYYGKIKKNRVENFIVDIEGEQYILRKGSNENGYRLIETYGGDSLKFTKEGHTFTIQLIQ